MGSHCVACRAGVPSAQPLSDADARRLVGARERDTRRAASASRRPSWLFFALLALFAALCAAAYALPLTRAELSAVPVAVRAVSIGIVVVGTLITVSLHEWAHAFVAYRGGDTSVLSKGYLTLDFRRYSDPLLSIGYPIIFLLLGGLPLPGGAVWINRGLLRSKGWASAVSLAGSLMNLLAGFGIAALVATHVVDAHPVLAGALAWLAFIQIGVGLLNLLPMPGLDGYGVLEPHLPVALRRAVEPFARYGLLILLVLMMTGLLGFLWDWADVLIGFTGLDPRWIGIGATIASVRA